MATKFKLDKLCPFGMAKNNIHCVGEDCAIWCTFYKDGKLCGACGIFNQMWDTSTVQVAMKQ